MKLNCLLLVLLVVATAWGQEKGQKKAPLVNPEGKKISASKSSLNQRAPEFVVETWLSEKPALAGKFLLLDFWATWCGPCVAAIPEANQLQQRFKDKLVVIGVSNEPEDVVRQHTKPAIEYYSAIDTQERMKKELAIFAIPYLIIVDPQGIVRFEGDPFLHHNVLKNHELWEKTLEELVAKYGK